MTRGTLAALALLMLQPGTGLAAPAAPTTSEILEIIQRRVTTFLSSTLGIASTRRVVTRIYDPDTNRLIQTTDALQKHRFYHYREPSIRIIRCKVDGQPKPPGDCDSRYERNQPHFPVFGPGSAERYQVKITGQVRCGADRCHRVEVVPRQRSVRHFQGTMLFRVKDLLLRELEGSVSYLPFPLQHLYLKLHFTRPSPDLVAMSRGYLDVWVRIPLLYKRRFVTRITASHSRAIPRQAAAGRRGAGAQPRLADRQQ